MKIAIPDLISNSYFPVIAAVELGMFKREGLDVELELVVPVEKALAAMGSPPPGSPIDLTPISQSPVKNALKRCALLPIVGPPETRVFRLLSRRWAGRAGGSHEANRGLVADGPVRPILVVVLAPILQLFAGVGKGQEPMRVEALRPEASVERLDEGVVGRFSGA